MASGRNGDTGRQVLSLALDIVFCWGRVHVVIVQSETGSRLWCASVVVGTLRLCSMIEMLDVDEIGTRSEVFAKLARVYYARVTQLFICCRHISNHHPTYCQVRMVSFFYYWWLRICDTTSMSRCYSLLQLQSNLLLEIWARPLEILVWTIYKNIKFYNTHSTNGYISQALF
jgi:hypothetical protein